MKAIVVGRHCRELKEPLVRVCNTLLHTYYIHVWGLARLGQGIIITKARTHLASIYVVKQRRFCTYQTAGVMYFVVRSTVNDLGAKWEKGRE